MRFDLKSLLRWPSQRGAPTFIVQYAPYLLVVDASHVRAISRNTAFMRFAQCLSLAIHPSTTAFTLGTVAAMFSPTALQPYPVALIRSNIERPSRLVCET